MAVTTWLCKLMNPKCFFSDSVQFGSGNEQFMRKPVYGFYNFVEICDADEYCWFKLVYHESCNVELLVRHVLRCLPDGSNPKEGVFKFRCVDNTMFFKSGSTNMILTPSVDIYNYCTAFEFSDESGRGFAWGFGDCFVNPFPEETESFQISMINFQEESDNEFSFYFNA